MTPSASAKLRALTAQEEIYWLLNWNSPIHPVFAAHVTGRTDTEQWRAALDQLQNRHPMLSVSIEAPERDDAGELASQDPGSDDLGSDDLRPFFKQHTGVPIPLSVLPRASVPRWEAVIAEEIATPLAPGQAPLLRAVLVYEPERSIIVLAGCHSIVDGMSLPLLLRDLLTALAGQSLEPLPLPRSAEELLGMEPAAPQRTDGKRDDLSSAPENKAGVPSVSSLQLSASLTQRLIIAARAHEVTVHGMLGAAVALAMRQQAPAFLSRAVRVISPASTRKVLGVEDACGMYFTSPGTTVNPAESQTFWEIARSVRQGIVEASTREALVAATTAMQGMIADGLTKAGAAEMLHGVFAEDVLLSNLGQTPFGSTFGPLHLESLWGPSVLAGLPEMQTIGVATTNSSLRLLLTSYQPIPRLLETMEEILSGICGSQAAS